MGPHPPLYPFRGLTNDMKSARHFVVNPVQCVERAFLLFHAVLERSDHMAYILLRQAILLRTQERFGSSSDKRM